MNRIARLFCSALVLSLTLFGACAKPDPMAAGQAQTDVLEPVPHEDPGLPTHNP